MAKLREFLSSFQAGLLSSGLDARIELDQYASGCRQLLNWWPLITGGAKRRPGSLYLNDDEEQTSRYEPFTFNEEQQYVVRFSANAYKVFDKDTGAELDSGTGSWTDALIPELTIIQRGDKMFVFHRTLQPRVITRTSATTFPAAAFEFESETTFNTTQAPFIKHATPGAKLTPSGISGSIVLTTDEDVFEAGHAGYRFRYRGKQVQITGITNAQSATADVLEELDGAVTLRIDFQAGANGNDFVVGEVVVGRDTGIKAEVVDTRQTEIVVVGIAGNFAASTANEEIEGLTSGNIATLTRRFSTVPQATTDWDEEAFSPPRGWPGAAVFHSQRLWLGGSTSLPAHIFGSRVAAFFNFDVGEAFPADSIQALIADDQVNDIWHLVSAEHLQVFCDGAEYYAPQTENRPLVPETFNLLKQSANGCAKTVRPQVFNEATLYVQPNLRIVREFQWDDRRRKYVSPAISVLADEYITDVNDIAVLQAGYDQTEQMAFMVCGDDIVWYHGNSAEGIRAFGLWQTNGQYKDLCSLGGKLYAGVCRALKDGTRDVLERFEFTSTLDCAVELTGAAAASWAAAHPSFGGLPVFVIGSATTGPRSNDYSGGTYTLAENGALDLGVKPLPNVTIGLGFTQPLETMPIEVQLGDGLTVGMPKKIVSTDVKVRSTVAMLQRGQRIVTYKTEDDPTQPAPLALTQYKFWHDDGFQEIQTVTIDNDLNVPCEVLSIGGELEI